MHLSLHNILLGIFDLRTPLHDHHDVLHAGDVQRGARASRRLLPPAWAFARKSSPISTCYSGSGETLHFYLTLVGLPGFARDFYCQLCLLCFFVSMSLYLSVSPLPLYPLPPPSSFFPDKKFPVVEAYFWLDELFYI
jgi:hypothetical protein